MNLRKTPIASAVALAVMSAVYPAHAQQTDTSVTAEKAPASETGQSQKSTAKSAKKETGATGASATQAGNAKPQSTEAPSQAGGRMVVAQATPAPAPISPPPQNAESLGSVISVTVEGQFTLLTPFLGSFFGGNQTIDLASTATAQSPKRGSPASWDPERSSRSPPSSTWPAKHPSTPTRSPPDIDRPCT